jgi:two-component system response regulator YesN
VALSSYEEFALLKTAMDYGVTDYLLKLELSPEILKKTLENQKRVILYENQSIKDREISPYSKVAIALRRVLAGHYLEKELEDTLKLANPDIDKNKLSCAAVRFSLPHKGFGEGDLRTIEIAAHSAINNITKKYFPGISFLEESGLCLFVYSPGEDRKPKQDEMCGIIITMLKQYLNLDSAVGISSFEGGLGDIHQIMIDAVRGTEEIFYRGYGKVIYSSEIPEEPGGTGPRNPPLETAFDWTAFSKALELRRSSHLKEILRTLYGLLSDSKPRALLCKSPGVPAEEPPAFRISKTEAYNLCFSLAGATFSVLGGAGKDIFSENLYELIGRIETLEGLREWLKKFGSALLEWCVSGKARSRDDMIVAEVKNYVAENYRKPISLNEVAAHLSISSGYLSSLFKRRAGISFVEHVTEVKIDEAKKLLLTGQYRIGEVSGMVGYEDMGYFSKIFHKITGLTPKEYMARHVYGEKG